MGEKALDFGIVGAYESEVGVGVAPLISQTGEAINNSTDAEKVSVKKIPMFGTTAKFSRVNGNLVNIDYDNHATYFYICMYIFDGVNTKTVYITDDSCRSVPLPIAYAMLVEGDSDHDSVSSSISIGGMEYSTVKGTVPTQDRMDVIDASILEAGTVNPTQESTSDEDTIAAIGGLGSWLGTCPNANALLNYYLETSGDASHYHNLDIQTLLNKSTTANDSWLSSINNILRASEALAIEGESVNIDQVAETVVQLKNSTGLWNANRDWYLTFIDGLYYTDTDVDNLTVTTDARGNKVYTATIVYNVIDYYSFYTKKDVTSSYLLWGPTYQELYQLHKDGNALDFLIDSTITYEVTWTEGQRVGRDDNFNKVEGFTNETVNSSILTVVEQ